jgi:hypothetical protein
MATKKECDRCGRQWAPIPGETDSELCQLGFYLPYQKDIPPKLVGRVWTKRPRITDTFDLCQDCARATYKFATVFPEGIDSEPANSEADPPTSAG